MTKFLPFLLTEISKEERRQYLFLHALKEVIDEQTGASCSLEESDPTFTNGVGEIWALLIKYCGSNEESIRNVVAECIGRLCTVNPGHFVNELVVGFDEIFLIHTRGGAKFRIFAKFILINVNLIAPALHWKRSF